MKKYFFTITSLLVLVIGITSCSNEETKNSSLNELKEITINIQLPDGSIIYSNELQVSSLFTENASISNSQGKIATFNEQSIELAIATNHVGNIVMLSYFDPNDGTSISMNSETTAIAVVMMHPWTFDLSPNAKKEAIVYIKNLPQFQDYKELIENEIASGDDNPFTNETILNMIIELQNLTFNRFNEYKEPLEFSSDNSKVSIKNTISSVTYSVGLYDQNDVFIEQKLAKGLEKSHFFFQEFKNAVFHETPNSEQTASFNIPNDGGWVLKAKSGLSFDSSLENKQASFENSKILAANIIGIFSTKLKQIILQEKCNYLIGAYVVQGISDVLSMSESLQKFSNGKITGYELTANCIKFILDKSDAILGLIQYCDPKGEKVYGLDKIRNGVFGKFMAVLDTYSRAENVFNTTAMLTDWLQFDKEIEFCFEKTGNQISECTCGSVTDIDGNVYPSVKIGQQCWMQKNLNVSRYRNGDIIPQVVNINEWLNLTAGAWCYYQNNTANGPVYGKLYNWYAINDPRGLAPLGMHIPSDAEWVTVTNYLGGESIAGGQMKSTSGWLFNNFITNSCGFKALPGGSNEDFTNILYTCNYGIWWSSTSTELDSIFGIIRQVSDVGFECQRSYREKVTGAAVRCIKD